MKISSHLIVASLEVMFIAEIASIVTIKPLSGKEKV